MSVTKGAARFDFSFEVFASWSSPPKKQTTNPITTAFPPPKQSILEWICKSCSKAGCLQGSSVQCSSHAQRRMASSGSAAHLLLSPPPAPWHKWDQAACTPGIALFVTGAIRNGSPPCPARSGQQPSTAEHPHHCPPVTSLSGNLQETKNGPSLLRRCRFSIKLQLSWLAFVVVLFFG